MIARAMPFAGIASRNAVASSGGMGFVLRSIRGLREKIWIASAPTDLPRSGASAMLSAMETWAPRNMLPRAAIAFARMSLPILGRPRSALSSRRLVRGRELSRLHDQIRQGQLLLAPGERIREFLPAAVLDPSSNDRIPKEQLDLAQLVEPRDGRVDAHERDVEAVFLEQVRHHVLVEGPLGTPTTRAPACAAANASRPSPVPTSNTTFPRKSSCRNCSISIGRRASDSFAASLHGSVRPSRTTSGTMSSGSRKGCAA